MDSPSLQLAENDATKGSVPLKKGAAYRLCQAGQDATADAPCDPGLYAVDRRGVNITESVYACPPTQCLQQVRCAPAGCLPPPLAFLGA